MATEVGTQLAKHPLLSPKAEPKPEKKTKHRPRSQGDCGPQKGPVPGVVDLELVQEVLSSPKPQTPVTYRFGQLSHHSFFSRHHPHPQRVIHIQDLTGKPVCVVRDEFSLASLPRSSLLSRCLMGRPTISVPIGDPQSNRKPQLSSEAWKKELKELTSQVAVFTKESELKNKEKEEPSREQGAKYSAETGRLIPASTQALSRRSFRQGQRNHPASRDGGVQASLLQDQELLILELLCQILQTDSLTAIQYWLLYAPPKVSIPAEKLLNQLQEVQEAQETQQPSYSQSLKKTNTSPLPKSEKPEYIGKAQVLRIHLNEEEKAAKRKAEG